MKKTVKKTRTRKDAKDASLDAFREDPEDATLTTNQGLPLNDDQNSLRGGRRGPSLLEDFHLREKITHFDHERIPERVVHARGSAAHGFFQVYKSLSPLTSAAFLQNPSIRTPVFVRFSTVAGSRGSSDLARDVRGFAVKFYTAEGNFDLVGNNIPVFFIQDAIKFPDLIHAVKPEPHHEMPQAASAHDTFWDFISLMPEAMHMVLWVMSDRAIPRSLRMMEGFGVHTYRMVTAKGKSRFVKFHWKPLLGVHSVVWDEAQKISGKDPDFHRRDLWEAIESGSFPEWELGLQVVEAEDENAFAFDLLDPTKLIPEELVPVQRIGRMTLNRNPDNFFAETEQVAFHPGHIVSGIDFTNDPLLQGRLFSYTDTQLTRLGGPNFHEIPINRPVPPVHNLQRDGIMRQTINRGHAAYEPNTVGSGCPMQAAALAGGFVSFPEPLKGEKVRGRSEKFFDHFSQATLFWNSQSDPEKDHIVLALRFELGKLETPVIRERMVGMLDHVDHTLASRVAAGLGMAAIPRVSGPLNHSFPGGADPRDYQPRSSKRQKIERSDALSMAGTVKDTVSTRKVAILAADGVNDNSLLRVKKTIEAAGAQSKLVAPLPGALKTSVGRQVAIDFSLLTTSSVFFDAVYIPGGKASGEALLRDRDAVEFVAEAYRHFKTIAATGAGADFLQSCPGLESLALGGAEEGILMGPDEDAASLAKAFVASMAQHRHWDRSMRSSAAPTRSARRRRKAN